MFFRLRCLKQCIGIMTVDVFGYLIDLKNDYDTKLIVFVIQYQILIQNRVPLTR